VMRGVFRSRVLEQMVKIIFEKDAAKGAHGRLTQCLQRVAKGASLTAPSISHDMDPALLAAWSMVRSARDAAAVRVRVCVCV
jgi:hypothetical protein